MFQKQFANDYGVAADYYTKNDDNSCNCGFEQGESVFPQNPLLAQSYVPIQTMDKTFTPCVGLKMGTIFPELVSPYSPCQSVEENAFIKAMNTIGEGCNKCQKMKIEIVAVAAIVIAIITI